MTDLERQQFVASRKSGIGGSDIASLFSVGYGCRRRLWYDKTNTPEDYPRKDTKAMRFGRVLEVEIAAIYAEETGRGVDTKDTPLALESLPLLRVNVDRVIWKKMSVIAPEGHTEERWCAGVLEVKAVGREAFYKMKREGLPVDYIWQLQAGMLASGLSWGSFAIGCRDSGEVIHWDVERNETLCNEIRIEVPRFWKLVTGEGLDMGGGVTGVIEPNRLEPDDRRCQSCEFRTQCQGNALINIGEPAEYETDESLRPLVLEYIERRDLRKEAQDLFDETKAELECKLGNRGKVTAAGAKIQFYEFTKKAYTVAEHKERPLRVYPAKESK